MKYEKPRARDLSDVSLAGGNCASVILLVPAYQTEKMQGLV